MRAVEAQLGYTNDNKPQVAVLLEIVEGEHAGLTLTWYGYFTEKTETGTLRSLRLLGFKGDDLTDLSSVNGQAPCTIQAEADLKGVIHAKVRWIGGGALALKNVMTADQKAAFSASMKAKLAAIPSGEGNESAGKPLF